MEKWLALLHGWWYSWTTNAFAASTLNTNDSSTLHEWNTSSSNYSLLQDTNVFTSIHKPHHAFNNDKRTAFRKGSPSYLLVISPADSLAQLVSDSQSVIRRNKK